MTTPSTPTSTMKEAELKPCPFCGHLGDHEVYLTFSGWAVECINCSANVDRLESRDVAIAAWNRRSPVEAQPSAVAGEARSVVTQYELTPQERDLLTAKGVSHIPGRGEGAAAPSGGRPMTLRECMEAEEAPSVEPQPCAHDWHIWPETDGHEQKCFRCGAYRKTPDEDKFWEKKPAAAPVETEQPTCRCEREGLEKFLCSAGCHLPHKDGILQTEPAARPLPGGVPTGLSDEQGRKVRELMLTASADLAGWGYRYNDAASRETAKRLREAALSAGAPSSL